MPGYARTATIADHAAAASDIVLRRVNVTIQNHRVSKPGRSTGGSRLTSALLPCMQVVPFFGAAMKRFEMRSSAILGFAHRGAR